MVLISATPGTRPATVTVPFFVGFPGALELALALCCMALLFAVLRNNQIKSVGHCRTVPTDPGSLGQIGTVAIKDAESLDGAEVTITGSILSKQHVERGAVLILKAATVVAAPATKKVP